MVEHDFVKIVEEARRKKSTRTIYNASVEHAEVLFKNLLAEARENDEDVRIVTGDLREDFYARLTDEIRPLAKKVKLIVLNKEINLDNNAFWRIVRDGGGTALRIEAKMPHFVLVGHNKFRLELDHKQTKAIASFNNPSIGNALESAFDKLSEKALAPLPAP